jgi:hypothetical protein
MYQDSYAPTFSPFSWVTEQIAIGSVWAYQDPALTSFDFALNCAIEWAEACRANAAIPHPLAAMPNRLASGPTDRIPSAHEGFDDCYEFDVWLPQIERAVGLVTGELRRGRKVLVTCAQGRNRSALVVGEALIRLGGEPGETVLLIQAKRKRALSNRAFVDWLMRDRAEVAP